MLFPQGWAPGSTATKDGCRNSFASNAPLVITLLMDIIRLVLEGRRIAPGASRGRKVRTPKGAMPR